MQFFDHEKLRSAIASEFTSAGLCGDSNAHATTSMIETSLRGVDSHGINLFPHYHRAIKAGRINCAPEFRFSENSAATAVLDADAAIGHHSGAVAMKRAIEKAKAAGVGAVAVRNSSHFGAAAYFGLMAPPHDCLGFAFTNADALVKASNARESFFGTNPICFTAPLKSEAPLCLDMATSTISWNKRNNYLRNRESLEDGWAFDKNGQPTNNPADSVSLAPTGDYKGYALGMMVEVLSSVLAGSLLGKDIMPMFDSDLSQPRDVGHFVIAISIDSFGETNAFKERLQAMVDRIRTMERSGNEPVMVAGDPQKIFRDERLLRGIPVDEEKYAEYLAINQSFESCVLDA